MLLAPHILIGAAITTAVPNPLLGLLFAFLSHFLLDRIPHWEYSIEPLKEIKTKGMRYGMPILRRVMLDGTAGFILVIFAVAIHRGENSFFLALWGGFFGILADGLTMLFFLRKNNGLFSRALKIFYALHQKIHFDKKTGPPALRIGLATQAIASLVALYFLIF